MSTAATMMLNPGQIHRKPAPGQRSYDDLQRTQQPQQPHHAAPHQASALPPHPDPRIPTRNPSRSPVYGGSSQAPPATSSQNNHPPRFSSASTTSYNSTANNPYNPNIQRVPTNSSMPRRSTSSRSTGTATSSPTSYVALMRKQKATVWCDRAQHEDPRILAKHRADKMRAAMEVAGGKYHYSSSGDGGGYGGNRASTSSSIPGRSMDIRSKIRHPGAIKAHTYLGGANMSGAGVPIRLSATEVDDENDSGDEEHDARFAKQNQNQRAGSGRSSTGSGRPGRASGGGGYAHVNGGDDTTPPGGSPAGSLGYVAEEQTPVPGSRANQSDYFASAATTSDNTSPDTDAEQRFGGVAGLPPSKPKTEQDIKREEELRRRGSVDDRAMTMTGQRLFVANPDLSD